MNAALDNVGTTVTYSDPVEASPVDQLASLTDLARDLRQGKVDTLIIAGANPVFTAPPDLDFVTAQGLPIPRQRHVVARLGRRMTPFVALHAELDVSPS